MAEFRRDPVDGRWVIIATERRKRFVGFHTEPYPESGERCPFCAGNEALTPKEIFAFREPGSLKDGPGWRVRVIPNREPILKVETEFEREGVGAYDKISGLGAHEIIVECPEHSQAYSQLSLKNLTEIYLAYRERMIDLRKDQRLKYVLIFKNYGRTAGAMMDHPHSQLIALPILPKQINEELRGAKEYYQYKERCIFCDIVRQELEDRDRLVFENREFLVISPWAPIFPFELWVVPKAHRPAFAPSSDELVGLLAEAVKSTMVKLDQVLQHPHFNLILHSAPFGEENLEYYHWHLEIMPRLTQVAGFEYGSGFYINPVSPEEATSWLLRVEG